MCFLLDVTGSMDPQKNAVLNNIFDILDATDKAFPEVSLDVAFVGYRDVTDQTRFEVIPFTKDIADFCEKLTKVDCTGGGDEAEDVLGGMDQALKALDWSDARIKVMFHIGDSPHHGSIFHETRLPGYRCNDDHISLVASPRSYTDILADYADCHIDYNFALVANPRNQVTTREMARLFEVSYNGFQSKKKEFSVVDLIDFSPEHLFDKVLKGLTGSIRSFLSCHKK
jgi:hypothetical protein